MYPLQEVLFFMTEVATNRGRKTITMTISKINLNLEKP